MGARLAEPDAGNHQLVCGVRNTQHKISLGRSDILSERPPILAVIRMSRSTGIDGMLKQAREVTE